VFPVPFIYQRDNQSQHVRPHSEPLQTRLCGCGMTSALYRGEDDQDADLDAQLRSPGDVSSQSSRDKRDVSMLQQRCLP
jgi:hypothetical protein